LAALDLPEIDSVLNLDDFDVCIDALPIRFGRFPVSHEL
jgi:hypothetical protein